MSHYSDHPRPNYQHHAGFYRNINPDEDLSKPWESSPESTGSLPMSPFKPVFQPRNAVQHNPNGFLLSTSTLIVATPSKRKSWWRKLFRFMTSEKRPPQSVPVAFSSNPPNPYSERVPLHEWKQYGYWARPSINDVLCKNSPVLSEKSITTEELADLITNMRGTMDPMFREYPRRWLVGAKHRALPQCPARWKTPDPRDPLPFPWEVQVNPLLQHVLWGPSPLRWCIWDDPDHSLAYGRTAAFVRCSEQDSAQPATWPFLTCMHFNAVLGDDAYHFPWAFTACNPRGLKVGDVIAEIRRNFSVEILETELSSWPMYRQEATRRTYQQRLRRTVQFGREPTQQYMCRWDALGAQMYFRGIEPSVDGGGWMIVFGPY